MSTACTDLTRHRDEIIERAKTSGEWWDWRWQLRNRIADVSTLREFVKLTDEEAAEVESSAQQFVWAITPYYASLMHPSDWNCPIRKQVVPTAEELRDQTGSPDPLEEAAHSPVPNIIRVYPDRVAFLVTNQCQVYCRFCCRQREVGGTSSHLHKSVDEGIEWIRSNREIRDVLLTGGDPLMLSDRQLESIITRLREIRHVEIIRIGSRAPVTLPMRITPELCQMLSKYHPIWFNTHFNHPEEVTPEAAAACDLISGAGMPIGNQSVLLRGINDAPQVMKKLVQELVRIRVRPYYIYQCQTQEGTRHMRVPIERGVEIMRNLRGYTTGFAVPTFVLDTPFGKVPVMPDYVVGREGDYFVVKSYDGKLWREYNPPE